jgi:hypothetical protein
MVIVVIVPQKRIQQSRIQQEPYNFQRDSSIAKQAKNSSMANKQAKNQSETPQKRDSNGEKRRRKKDRASEISP